MVQRGNTFQVHFTIFTHNNTPVKNSPVFAIMSGAVAFQARIISSQPENQNSTVFGGSNYKSASNFFLVRFFKQYPEDNELTYTIKLACPEFSITDKRLATDDSTWYLIHEVKNISNAMQYSFSIQLIVDVTNIVNFASLHDDEELLDFELRGEGGVVRFHKAVLAASSPVFRRMLCGTWKEVTEGHVDLSGTSQSTLQNLKNYLYLGTLPATGLEQLLLVALYYMIPQLEQKCVDKLVQELTAQNACYYLEFATGNKVTRLLLAILDAVQNGEVQVKDIRNHTLRPDSIAE